jgi:hypothetical protein
LGTLKVQDQAETAATTIDTLLWVIVGTTITLLGMGLGALVLINKGEINERLGTWFVILTFVTLVVLEGVLVWRLLYLSRGTEKISAASQPNRLSTNELNPSSARALHEPLEPVASVTEETTRTLEPLYSKGERR